MNRRISVLALLLVSALAFSACEFKVSTANISDAKLSRSVDDKMEAVDPTTNFTTDDREFHAVVDLANAPDNTDVLGIWRTAAGEEIVRKNMAAGGNVNKVHFSMTVQNPLPPGKYACDIYIDRLASDSAAKPDKTLEFTVQ
jgi:hypothetical protein